MTGAIGGNTALTSLSINATTGDIALSLPQIGDGTSAGAGSASGAVAIGNTGSGDITFATTNAAGDGAISYLFAGDTTFKSGGDAAGDKAFQVAGDTTIKNTASTKSITFHTGTIELDADEDLTIETTNGAISLKNVVGTNGGNGSDLVVNAGTSTTSLSTISTNINDLTVSGTGVITLTGDITTADYTSGGSEDVGAQSYSGAVVLSGADRTVTANTGAITFSSTINSEASAARALSIVGIDGAVTVSGAIGTGTNGILGALDINTAEAAGNTGTISLAAIGTDSAAGAASITVGNSRTAT